MNPLENIGSSAGQENIVQEVDKVDNNDDRISISVSRNAYDILVELTNQLNKENETQKLFTVEEVLDEEIILLFSDEWKKKYKPPYTFT